ncbi:MAG: glutamate synthase [Methanomicrobiales archaeon]|nr:glutamate synthase [Methanomicrobiales archaeon]
MKYRCEVCNVFEYETERGNSLTGILPGTQPPAFPEGWVCPICGSGRMHLKPVIEKLHTSATQEITCPVCGSRHTITVAHRDVSEVPGYLGTWERPSDTIETAMSLIHTVAATREPVIEPMRTRRPVVGWEDILIKGAQLAKLPLNPDEPVATRTVIGPAAAQPLVLETPVFVTHMSFGALSREVKIALAQGSAAVKTAIGSGEGGILQEEREAAYRYIFEYVPNRYSATPENLRAADAVEIKIGQSTKPGMGGHLPAEKVTAEIAAIRGFPEGQDIVSPARFDEIREPRDLATMVQRLRTESGGRPIGIKIAAGSVEADMAVAVAAGPDFITIDGRPGGTAASPKAVKDAASVPTPFALYRARRYLNERGIRTITLVATGGFRGSSDIAKALALGADAVALGTAALMACACQQYRLCDTGTCPVGVTTHDPELRKRFVIELSAKKLENFLAVTTEELRDFARLTGNADVHGLAITDLCTTDSEISGHTAIEHV